MTTSSQKLKLWTPYERPRRAIILSLFKRRGYKLEVYPRITVDGWMVSVQGQPKLAYCVGVARTKKHAQKVVDRWNESILFAGRQMQELANQNIKDRFKFDDETVRLLKQIEDPRDSYSIVKIHVPFPKVTDGRYVIKRGGT